MWGSCLVPHIPAIRNSTQTAPGGRLRRLRPRRHGPQRQPAGAPQPTSHPSHRSPRQAGSSSPSAPAVMPRRPCSCPSSSRWRGCQPRRGATRYPGRVDRGGGRVAAAVRSRCRRAGNRLWLTPCSPRSLVPRQRPDDVPAGRRRFDHRRPVLAPNTKHPG
jgi:hypothetical protein